MEIVRHTGLAKEHRASTYGFTAVGGVWSDGYWKKRGIHLEKGGDGSPSWSVFNGFRRRYV